MNYAKKQRKAKLDNWYIARRLGLKLNEWLEVRTGKRRLANDKLDTFNELTYEGANEWINQDSEKQKINEWFDNTSKEDFQKLLNDFNVIQGDVAKSIGANVSSINKTINKKEVNENAKAMLYYFFNDENNKKYRRNKTRAKQKVKKEEEVVNEVKEPTEEFIKVDDREQIKKVRELSKDYNELREELERYKFLIDEIRRQNQVISSLMGLKLGEIENE